MPLYDFKCKKCNEVFEALVKSDVVPPCPKCKAIETEKQIAISNFNFYFENGAGTLDGGTFKHTKLFGKDI
ncbi:MAG: FmdB family zinc ribbon protein [Burkholderiales bacterium]